MKRGICNMIQHFLVLQHPVKLVYRMFPLFFVFMQDHLDEHVLAPF